MEKTLDIVQRISEKCEFWKERARKDPNGYIETLICDVVNKTIDECNQEYNVKMNYVEEQISQLFDRLKEE